MKKMKDMLEKAPSEHDDKYDAKMSVLNELRDMASGMMGDRVKDKLPGKSMKEVSVAAPDAKGLQKGLDLASHMLPDDEQAEQDEDAAEERVSPGIHQKIDSMIHANPHHDQSENSPYSKDMIPSDNENSHESDFNDDMSDDELDSMIQELEDHRKSRQSKV